MDGCPRGACAGPRGRRLARAARPILTIARTPYSLSHGVGKQLYSAYQLPCNALMLGSHSTGWSTDGLATVTAVGAGCDVQTCGLELGRALACRSYAQQKDNALTGSREYPLKRVRVRIPRAVFHPFRLHSELFFESSLHQHRLLQRAVHGAPAHKDGKLRLPRDPGAVTHALEGQAPKVSPAYSGAARRTPPPKMTMACSVRACERSSGGVLSSQ